MPELDHFLSRFIPVMLMTMPLAFAISSIMRDFSRRG